MVPAPFCRQGHYFVCRTKPDTSFSCHPGALRTELTREWTSGIFKAIMPILHRVLLYPPEMGCITQLYLNTAPEAASKGGAYFVPWARECEPLSIANDLSVQDACTWSKLTLVAKWCEEQVAKHVRA